MADSFRIPGRSVPVLEGIALIAGVDCQTYVGQSLLLGIDLADIALDAGDLDTHILFEQEDGGFDRYPIEFGKQLDPPMPAEMELLAQLLSANEPIDFICDDSIVEAIDERAQRLITSRIAFFIFPLDEELVDESAGVARALGIEAERLVMRGILWRFILDGPLKQEELFVDVKTGPDSYIPIDDVSEFVGYKPPEFTLPDIYLDPRLFLD